MYKYVVYVCVHVHVTVCTYVCVCVFVGGCLATKVFTGQISSYMQTVGHYKVVL